MALRVLVVDDNPVARFLIKEMIESSGHQMIAEAENLAETIKAYQEHKPDVVTLDLSLVQDDGMSILKELRKIDAKAKILVVTGNSQKRVLDQVIEAGAAAFLNKPFHIEDLLGALQKVAGA